MGFEIKTFNVFFRLPNKKIQTTKFFVTLENIKAYGIEQFYLDLQKTLELKHRLLCFLKVNEKTLIADRCNFTTRPQGKSRKTKKQHIENLMFAERWGYDDTDTRILDK